MQKFFRKNIAIVTAFVLPVALIVTIALVTYLPSLFVRTDYNFVYAVCTDVMSRYRSGCNEYLQTRYSVIDNTLIVNDRDSIQDSDDDGILDAKENYTTRLFIHDTEKNKSREITVKEARSLHLSNLLTSPDGINVSGRYDGGAGTFFLFGGRSSYDYYLSKGKSRSKLNLINPNNRYYYRDDLQFIGWVLSGRN